MIAIALMWLVQEAQETPATPEDPAAQEVQDTEFKFENAPSDAVFEAVSRVTGLQVVNKTNWRGRLSVYSATTTPPETVIEALNSALAPNSLAAMRIGDLVVILTREEAMRSTPQIVIVMGPETVSLTEEIKTFVIRLNNLNVVDAERELRPLFPQGAQVAVNRHSNSIVITDQGMNVRRIVEILKHLDILTLLNLKVVVYTLRNSNALMMAQIIEKLFIAREQGQGQESDPWGMRAIMRMFSRREGGGEQPLEAQPLATDIVRVTSDLRTNSVIVATSEDNHKVIKKLIDEVDSEIPASTHIAVFDLRYADATQVAKTVNDLFEEPEVRAQREQQQAGGRRFQFFGMPQAPQGESNSSPLSVRAIADTRTNSVIVAASEQQIELVRELVEEMDRQVGDVLSLKVYVLENASATEMATIIREMFPKASSSTSGGRAAGMARFFGAPAAQAETTASSLTQVEVSADARTNSIVVKASEEYMAIVDELVRELDGNPTEKVSTFVVNLEHASATETANLLRQLMGLPARQTQTQQPQQGATNAQDMLRQLRGQGSGTRPSSTGGSGTRQGGQRSTGSRFPQMGPLQEESLTQEEEDELRRLLQEQESQRRALEGDIDIESDNQTNSLVIRTSPRNLRAIQSVLAQVDRPRPQVLIEALIVDISVDDALNLGVDINRLAAGEAWTIASTFEGLNNQLLGQGGFNAHYDRGRLDAAVQALAREGRAEVIATPRILVMNNQPANITIGSEVPLIQSTQTTAQGGTINVIGYESVGILLEVVPQINPNGQVTMTIHPEVSDIDFTRTVPIQEELRDDGSRRTVTAPTISVNSANTTVTIRHGQTVALGGLVRKESTRVRQKVPVLGDVPLIGQLLFSRWENVDEKREMIIFLTPYVVYTQRQLDEVTEMTRARLRLVPDHVASRRAERWAEFIRD